MTPVFYCENCKKKVSAKDKICPGCGKFFTDVRCPRCGHSGNVDEFLLGCPQCGYLNPALANAGAGHAPAFLEALPPHMFADSVPSARAPRRNPGRLHAWFFLSLTLGIGTICAALVYLFMAR